MPDSGYINEGIADIGYLKGMPQFCLKPNRML